MATFTWVPDYAAQVDEEPKILEASYGDSYTQRAQDGINPLMKKWTVKFFRRYSEVNDIRDFLKARGATEAFDWVDLFGEAGLYRCKKWSVVYDAFGGGTISGEFQEVPA